LHATPITNMITVVIGMAIAIDAEEVNSW